jgi:hypothetical protein
MPYGAFDFTAHDDVSGIRGYDANIFILRDDGGTYLVIEWIRFLLSETI